MLASVIEMPIPLAPGPLGTCESWPHGRWCAAHSAAMGPHRPTWHPGGPTPALADSCAWCLSWDSPRPRDLAAGFMIQMLRSPSISVWGLTDVTLSSRAWHRKK